MVDQPEQAYDGLEPNAEWLNGNWRDQLLASFLHLATTAGQIAYATGERELAVLDPPSGITNPVLKGGATPEWVAAGDVSGGGGFTSTQLFNANVGIGVANRWYYAGTLTVSPNEVWSLVWSDQNAERYPKIFATNALLALATGNHNSSVVNGSQLYISGSEGIYVGRTSTNRLLVGSTSTTDDPQPLIIHRLAYG